MCPQESNPQVTTTAASGDASLSFRRVGGHGSMQVDVVAGTPSVLLASFPVLFTSPDLTATCNAAPDPCAVTVADLGLWAYGLSSPVHWSDYACGGGTTVADLGWWAVSLGGCHCQ
jgi:hypothetical protein